MLNVEDLKKAIEETEKELESADNLSWKTTYKEYADKMLEYKEKIRFDGHSVIAEKNGMRFDLLGNKLK